MLATEKYYGIGLCSGCNNSSECVYRKRRGFDAIYCETFDNLNGSAKYSKSILKEADFSYPGEKAIITHLGLCTNCENRDSCQLPKPDAGVWHCEEYI